MVFFRVIQKTKQSLPEDIRETCSDKINPAYETTQEQRTAAAGEPLWNGPQKNYYGKCPKISNIFFHTFLA